LGQSDLGISAHNFAYLVWDPGKYSPAKCNAAF